MSSLACWSGRPGGGGGPLDSGVLATASEGCWPLSPPLPNSALRYAADSGWCRPGLGVVLVGLVAAAAAFAAVKLLDGGSSSGSSSGSSKDAKGKALAPDKGKALAKK